MRPTSNSQDKMYKYLLKRAYCWNKMGHEYINTVIEASLFSQKLLVYIIRTVNFIKIKHLHLFFL